MTKDDVAPSPITPSASKPSKGMVGGFLHLFFSKKFQAHRLVGLAYLVQYVATVFLYVTNYPAFLKSPLISKLKHCLYTCPL